MLSKSHFHLGLDKISLGLKDSKCFELGEFLSCDNSLLRECLRQI